MPLPSFLPRSSPRVFVARLPRGLELRFRSPTPRRVLRPLLGLGGAALLLCLARLPAGSRSPETRTPALVAALGARGLDASEGDVTWLPSGSGGVRGALFGGARALVRARERGEPSDLYVVDARLSPEGALLEIGSAYNVTRTIGVDETTPVVAGLRAATTTSAFGVIKDVHVLDLAGRDPSLYADFTRVQRWQTAITNVQQTGQRAGIVHDVFVLDPPASDLTLAWREPGGPAPRLVLTDDARTIAIDPTRAAAVEGAKWVRAQPEVKAAPGGIVTWSVNRVRAMPWFGEENMQVLKAVVYTALDYVNRAKDRVAEDATEAEVARDLGAISTSGQETPVFTDPEIGWPPPPLEPIVTPSIAGEGKWILIDRDPFVRNTPGLPPAFATTFVRADKARLSTRVYVTVWDPRQIALHMQAGTVEPVSATGEAGSGEIPRAPEVLDRLVAGFNGGFQAMHGEFGMQADGVLYLPPKPYAATVLEMRDGSLGMGAWPEVAEVPDDVVSFRQNLTALVQGGRFNPWGRTWWGGTPKGWADEVHTTRSGLCLTKENFVGYFWGNGISADVLAAGMLAARCAFGMHLDMNTGHAGFEFYNLFPEGSAPPLGRATQSDWEFDGTMKALPDVRVRARRMVKTMGHMSFPRYIRRDERDFFYLTRRPLLPGADRTPALGGEPGEGAWRVQGLPQHGFPYALATTSLRPDAAHPSFRVKVLRVDPHAVEPTAAPEAPDSPTVVTFVRSGGAARAGIYWDDGVFFAGAEPPTPSATAVALGVPANAPAAAAARTFAGVEDVDGMLVWVELAPDVAPGASAATSAAAMLHGFGCSSPVALFGGAHARIGGQLDVGGELPATGAHDAGHEATTVRMVRRAGPGARPRFEATPIVRPSVWQPLQSQRVRYFHRKTKSAEAPTPTPK